MSRSTSYSGTFGPASYDVRRYAHPSIFSTSHSRISQRSRPHSPPMSYAHSSVSSSVYSQDESRVRLRWILSLGLLLPALAAIIGVVAWAVSAEIVIGARRDHALKTSDALRFLPQTLHEHESNSFRMDRLESDSSKIELEDNAIRSMIETTEEAEIMTELPPDVLHEEPSLPSPSPPSQPAPQPPTPQLQPTVDVVKMMDLAEMKSTGELKDSLKNAIDNAIKESNLNISSTSARNVIFVSAAGMGSLTKAANAAIASSSSGQSTENPIRKSAGARVAEVIDKIIAQRKSSKKGSSNPPVVVVAPLGKKSRPSTSTTTRRPSRNSMRRPAKSTTTSTTTTTTTEEPSTQEVFFSRDADTILAAARMLSMRHRNKMAFMRADDTFGYNEPVPSRFESASLIGAPEDSSFLHPPADEHRDVASVPPLPPVLPPRTTATPKLRRQNFSNQNRFPNRMGPVQISGGFMPIQGPTQAVPTHMSQMSPPPSSFPLPHGPLMPHPRPSMPSPPQHQPPPPPSNFHHQQGHNNFPHQHQQHGHQPQQLAAQPSIQVVHQFIGPQHQGPSVQGTGFGHQQQQPHPHPQAAPLFIPNNNQPQHQLLLSHPGSSSQPQFLNHPRGPSMPGMHGPPMSQHQPPPPPPPLQLPQNPQGQQHHHMGPAMGGHQQGPQYQMHNSNANLEGSGSQHEPVQDSSNLYGSTHYTEGNKNNAAVSLQVGQPHGNNDKGLTLHFGGGPIGGGGQLITSPVGIFKTLLLPLLPKPRVNLNGKVVFGVVLEKTAGFGKQPKPKPFPFYG